MRSEAFDEGIVGVHSLPIILTVNSEESVKLFRTHCATFNVLTLVSLVLIEELDQQIALALSPSGLILVQVSNVSNDLLL